MGFLLNSYLSVEETGGYDPPDIFTEDNFTECPADWFCSGPTYSGGTVSVGVGDAFRTDYGALSEGEIWIAFQLDINVTGFDVPMELKAICTGSDGDSDGFGLMYMHLGSIVIAGGHNNSAPDTFSPTSDEYYWIHFVKGTGANGVFEVWNGATGTFSSATKKIDLSNGSCTNNLTTIAFMGDNGTTGGTMDYKQIHISTTNPGDM